MPTVASAAISSTLFLDFANSHITSGYKNSIWFSRIQLIYELTYFDIFNLLIGIRRQFVTKELFSPYRSIDMYII